MTRAERQSSPRFVAQLTYRINGSTSTEDSTPFLHGDKAGTDERTAQAAAKRWVVDRLGRTVVRWEIRRYLTSQDNPGTVVASGS